MAVVWSRRYKQWVLWKTIQQHVYLQTHLPMWMKRWLNCQQSLFLLELQFFGTYMPKLNEQDQLVWRGFVHSQSNCIFTNWLMFYNDSSSQVRSVTPHVVPHWGHRSPILWLVHTGIALCTLRTKQPWVYLVTLFIWSTWDSWNKIKPK